MRCGGPGLCSECAADASRARAALAQPSPAQAEQHWPKLEKPAQVGGGRFSAGVSSRLVVEAAQRLYEFESTPEKEAERIERLQAFREQLDPLNLAPHAEAFNEAPAEALKSEQAEVERPEVVAWRNRMIDPPQSNPGWKLVTQPEGKPWLEEEPLMTVAQHERIVGALRFERQQMDRAFTACINERDAAQAEVARLIGVCASLDSEKRDMEHKRDAIIAMRDAALAEVEADRDLVKIMQEQIDALRSSEEVALARVAELTATRNRYGVDAHYFNMNLQRILRDFESFTPDELARSLIILAKVADEKVVAQAQHSVPGDIMRDAQRYRWLRDQQFYFSFSTENSDAGISSCTAGMSSRFKNLSWVDAAIDSAIAAAPGKEVGHE